MADKPNTPGLEEDHLGQADKHIADGQARIDEARHRIAAMEADGHDATRLKAVLATLEDTLRAMVAHRETIVRELQRKT